MPTRRDRRGQSLNSSPLEAVLFDFDDCLFDTARDRTDTTVLTLHENGYPEVNWEVARRELGGETAGRFIATAGIEDLEEGERLAALWDETNLRVGYPHASPFPGVLETLEALDGYPKGIVSASLRPVIRGVLERFGWSERFPEIVGKEDVREPKPSTEGLLMLCERMGTDPTHCLYVGDTPNDIRAGKAAGMMTVAATYGMGEKEELRRENPDWIVDRFEELLEIVRRAG